MEQVRKLPLLTVRPGMVLARDIVSGNGQILFSYGIQLTDQNIHLLKERGILFVDVVYDNWLIKSQDQKDIFTCKPIIKLVDGTFLDLQENKKVEIIDIAK